MIIAKNGTQYNEITNEIIKAHATYVNSPFVKVDRALNYKKNRQTLHKYENGTLNIPYEILFEICRIFNIDNDAFKNDPIPDPVQDQTDKAIQQAAETHNPAFNIFEQVGNDIEEAVSMRSVVTQRHTDQYISNPIFTSVLLKYYVLGVLI